MDKLDVTVISQPQDSAISRTFSHEHDAKGISTMQLIHKELDFPYRIYT